MSFVSLEVCRLDMGPARKECVLFRGMPTCKHRGGAQKRLQAVNVATRLLSLVSDCGNFRRLAFTYPLDLRQSDMRLIRKAQKGESLFRIPELYAKSHVAQVQCLRLL